MAAMLAAYSAAARLRKDNKIHSPLPDITMQLVYLIVFVMGIRLGMDHQLLGEIKNIGVQAVIISIACTGGSMIAVFALRLLTGTDRFGNIRRKICKTGIPDNNLQNSSAHTGGSVEPNDSHAKRPHTELKSAVIILIFMAVGIFAGALISQHASSDVSGSVDVLAGKAINIILCIMVAFAGFSLGLSGKAGECLKAAGMYAIAFPAAAIIGTLVAGALSGSIMGFSLKEGLAISAGFGWYTYAPAVIADAGAQYSAASAVAFLYNMIRETASIVLIPVFAKHVGYLEAVSMPGAAAKDICLPIIESSCRQDTMIYAFMTGLAMNIFTFAGVPLIMQL